MNGLPPLFPLPDFGQVARAIAAGIVQEKSAGRVAARLTLTLQPSAATTVEALAIWPDILKAFFGAGESPLSHAETADILISPFGSDDPRKTATVLAATLAWKPPTVKVANLILDLWQRMMAPPDPRASSDPKAPWKDLIKVLSCGEEKMRSRRG